MKLLLHAIVVPLALSALAFAKSPQTLVDPIPLPTDRDVLQISTDTLGLHRISYDAMVKAGFLSERERPLLADLSIVRDGFAVDYFLESTARYNHTFDPGETLWFYASGFHGTRHEKDFVPTNDYWLWFGGGHSKPYPTGGTGDRLGATKPASAAVVYEDSFWESLVLERDEFFTTYPRAKNGAVMDATHWMWARLDNNNEEEHTTNYQMVVPAAEPGRRFRLNLEVEHWGGKYPSTLQSGGGTVDLTMSGEHLGELQLPGFTGGPATLEFEGASEQLAGVVDLSVRYRRTASDQRVYLDRMVFEYRRKCLFPGGSLTIRAAGMPEGLQGFRVWGRSSRPFVIDITNPDHPVRIFPAIDRGGLRFLAEGTPLSRYLVHDLVSGRKPDLAVRRCRRLSTRPVQWLALGRRDLLTGIHMLRWHRNSDLGGGLATDVVDLEQVVMQVGYGKRSPETIRRYLESRKDGLEYVLLVGDAALNNLGKDDGGVVSQAAVGSLPAWLPKIGRFMGTVVSDLPYADLDNDGLPEVAVGRLTARSEAEARTMASKIIRYEDLVLLTERGQGPDSMRRVYMVADNADGAGNFERSLDGFEPYFNNLNYTADRIHLEEHYDNDIDAFRADLIPGLARPWSTVLYSGHGHIPAWANFLFNGDIPRVTDTTAHPAVYITGNCLDGNFAWGSLHAITEHLMRSENGGAAAVFAETELDYLYESKFLREKFLEGPAIGLHRVGDAFMYSIREYLEDSNYYSAVADAFALQGDPAMRWLPELSVRGAQQPKGWSVEDASDRLSRLALARGRPDLAQPASFLRAASPNARYASQAAEFKMYEQVVKPHRAFLDKLP